MPCVAVHYLFYTPVEVVVGSFVRDCSLLLGVDRLLVVVVRVEGMLVLLGRRGCEMVAGIEARKETWVGGSRHCCLKERADDRVCFGRLLRQVVGDIANQQVVHCEDTQNCHGDLNSHRDSVLGTTSWNVRLAVCAGIVVYQCL
jgi:hypothetical protein